jgi:Spy/CpxP family protein refolding chaperone
MLRMVFSIIILPVIFLVAPLAAAAQDIPAGKWWYSSQIQKNLNLSKNEIGQLDQLFADSRIKLIKLKSEVESQQFELDQLLSKKKVDDADVKKQFHKLEQARKNLANERLNFVIGVRNILGADRFQQLKSNFQKWQ